MSLAITSTIKLKLLNLFYMSTFSILRANLSLTFSSGVNQHGLGLNLEMFSLRPFLFNYKFQIVKLRVSWSVV